jgi:hypothetical protein
MLRVNSDDSLCPLNGKVNNKIGGRSETFKDRDIYVNSNINTAKSVIPVKAGIQKKLDFGSSPE